MPDVYCIDTWNLSSVQNGPFHHYTSSVTLIPHVNAFVFTHFMCSDLLFVFSYVFTQFQWISINSHTVIFWKMARLCGAPPTQLIHLFMHSQGFLNEKTTNPVCHCFFFFFVLTYAVLYLNCRGLNDPFTSSYYRKKYYVSGKQVRTCSLLYSKDVNCANVSSVYHNLRSFKRDLVFFNRGWEPEPAGPPDWCCICPPPALALKTERSNTADRSVLTAPWAESWWQAVTGSLGCGGGGSSCLSSLLRLSQVLVQACGWIPTIWLRSLPSLDWLCFVL